MEFFLFIYLFIYLHIIEFIDYNEEFRSILVSIGLIAICLILLLLLYSLIHKCIKMFKAETIPTTKSIWIYFYKKKKHLLICYFSVKQHQQRYYTNRFTNRHISTMSSVSSSLFLLNYRQSSKTLSPIVHV